MVLDEFRAALKNVPPHELAEADITDAGDHTLDDNVHIGVHLSF